MAVAALNAPAGKHETAGQELVTGMATAHQHLGDCLGTIDQNQRGGIAPALMGVALVTLGPREPLNDRIGAVVHEEAVRRRRWGAGRDARLDRVRCRASTRPSDKSS